MATKRHFPATSPKADPNISAHNLAVFVTSFISILLLIIIIIFIIIWKWGFPSKKGKFLPLKKGFSNFFSLIAHFLLVLDYNMSNKNPIARDADAGNLLWRVWNFCFTVYGHGEFWAFHVTHDVAFLHKDEPISPFVDGRTLVNDCLQ